MSKLFMKIISIFARILRYISVIAFAGGGMLVPHLNIPNSFEMPLGQLSGLAVDSEGNIYCGSQFYNRIQVYNPNGHFLYGVSLHIGGPFWIRINSDDQLEVAATRGRYRFTFDKNGKRLRASKNVPNYTEGFDTKRNYTCYDAKRHVTYEIKPILSMFFLGSHVVRKDALWRETVIIKVPFLQWLFMAPFPSWFFFPLSVLISLCFDDKFRDEAVKTINGDYTPEFLLPKNSKTEKSD